MTFRVAKDRVLPAESLPLGLAELVSGRSGACLRPGFAVQEVCRPSVLRASGVFHVLSKCTVLCAEAYIM